MPNLETALSPWFPPGKVSSCLIQIIDAPYRTGETREARCRSVTSLHEDRLEALSGQEPGLLSGSQGSTPARLTGSVPSCRSLPVFSLFSFLRSSLLRTLKKACIPGSWLICGCDNQTLPLLTCLRWKFAYVHISKCLSSISYKPGPETVAVVGQVSILLS